MPLFVGHLLDRAFYNEEKKDREHFFIRGEKKKRPKKIRLIPIRKKTKGRDIVSVLSKDINKGTWNKKERMNRKRKARGANTSLRFFVVKKVKKMMIKNSTAHISDLS